MNISEQMHGVAYILFEKTQDLPPRSPQPLQCDSSQFKGMLAPQPCPGSKTEDPYQKGRCTSHVSD